jgi:hypothetical protein
MGNKLTGLFKKRLDKNKIDISSVNKEIVIENLRGHIMGSQEYNNRYGCKLSSERLLAFRLYLSVEEFVETVESAIKGNFIISNPDTFQEIINGGINLDKKDKYVYFCYTIHSKAHNWI